MKKNERLLKRTVIAAAESALRRSLKKLVNKTKSSYIIGEARDGNSLLEYCRSDKPDLVISQKHLIRSMKSSLAMVNVIAITTQPRRQELIRLIKSDVKAHLFNENVENELVTAVEKVNNGHYYYCAKTTDMIGRTILDKKFTYPEIEVNTFDVKDKKITLSNLQIQVIRLVCQGFTNEEIAKFTGRAKRTIDTIRDTIIKDTGSRNTASLVVYAIKNKIFAIN